MIRSLFGEKMKLGTIWNSREAFFTLAALKKSPAVSYRLMKYAKKFADEVDLIDRRRNELILEVLGLEKNDPEARQASLNPGMPEFNEFVSKFGDFLSTESDLEVSGFDMEELVSILDSEKGNLISENDLILLEPFFEIK